MKITDKVYNKLCKTLENYDTGINKKPETLYKMLEKIYDEWEYILRGE